MSVGAHGTCHERGVGISPLLGGLCNHAELEGVVVCGCAVEHK